MENCYHTFLSYNHIFWISMEIKCFLKYGVVIGIQNHETLFYSEFVFVNSNGISK